MDGFTNVLPEFEAPKCSLPKRRIRGHYVAYVAFSVVAVVEDDVVALVSVVVFAAVGRDSDQLYNDARVAGISDSRPEPVPGRDSATDKDSSLIDMGFDNVDDDVAVDRMVAEEGFDVGHSPRAWAADVVDFDVEEEGKFRFAFDRRDNFDVGMRGRRVVVVVERWKGDILSTKIESLFAD